MVWSQMHKQAPPPLSVTYVSDQHLPDDKLGKWQCGLEVDGEGTARGGHKDIITLRPVLLTFFLERRKQENMFVVVLSTFAAAPEPRISHTARQLYLHLLTLSSNILVNMTTVGTRCSHIMRQKSSTELSVGPARRNESSSELYSFVVVMPA